MGRVSVGPAEGQARLLMLFEGLLLFAWAELGPLKGGHRKDSVNSMGLLKKGLRLHQRLCHTEQAAPAKPGTHSQRHPVTAGAELAQPGTRNSNLAPRLPPGGHIL